MKTLLKGGVLKNCAKMEKVFLRGLSELKDRFSFVKNIRGKGLILLAVILVGGYFFLRGGGGGCNLSQIAQQLATGGFLNRDSFRKASIYEPVSEDDPNNPPLPESANLQRFAPSVGNQGQQGSCVAWSSAYAARSILESARTGQPGEQVKFSPAF